MTKMATIPIYGKNLYKSSPPEAVVYDFKLGMQYWGLKLYEAGINYDLWLILTYFTAWSKLVACIFEWETLLQSDSTVQWGKLAAYEQINKRFIFWRTEISPVFVCPCPGSIYMYMTIISNIFFLLQCFPIR